MKISTVQPDHPLNRPTAKPLAPLAGGDFKGQLDAQMAGPSPATALSSDLHASGPLRPLSPLENIPGLEGDPGRPLQPLEAPPPPLVPLNDLDRIPGQRQTAPAAEDQVTATARKWVAQTFYGTLLRQMRNSPFKSELFDGGRGGQAFAPLLDQHLIDHMSRGTAGRLTGAIARKLAGHRASRPAAGRPATPRFNPFENMSIHVAPGLRA